MLKRVQTKQLEVAYQQSGPEDGDPVILLHGFPYDVCAYDEVAATLADAGCNVVVPYLRGFGSTRFLSGQTLRSGQQAVLAQDLLSLMDALYISRAALAGYDWGGRAACIVAALWPERVKSLVSQGGYNIQDISASAEPRAPEIEYRAWYQFYFLSERGRKGLDKYRRELCRLLWRLWSPAWHFQDETYERTAASFDNPDFVEVVIHSYRHRFGLVPGDPAVQDIEDRLTARPRISIPTIALDGGSSGIRGSGKTGGRPQFFTAKYEQREIPFAGHNLPQEAPREFAEAILSLRDES
jgi:pimeloyl-ACP methyl ester carboxylesterase